MPAGDQRHDNRKEQFTILDVKIAADIDPRPPVWADFDNATKHVWTLGANLV